MKDLVLVRDCKMVPHCREVSGKWVVAVVEVAVAVYRECLRSL